MPDDDAHSQSGEGQAARLATAREYQALYNSFGVTVSRGDALQMVRNLDGEVDEKRREILEAQRNAKPQFLKDNYGIRGQQQDAGDKLQVAGLNGQGKQMQNPAGDDAAFPSGQGGGDAADAPNVTALSAGIEGHPAIYRGPGTLELDT